MPHLVKKRSKKSGLPPGTPVHIGGRKREDTRITVLDYDESRFQEKEVGSVDQCMVFRDTPTNTWINVDGLHDVELIRRMGECFRFHPLLIEDIVNTDQRPKFEDFGDYLFLVAKMLQYDKKEHFTKIEQVSFVVGKNFVISFQEDVGDVFDHVRERLRDPKSRVRRNGPDYLAYALLDSIVDQYFIILEELGEDIEVMEEEVVRNPATATIHRIHRLKRELIFLRKSVWPLREVLISLERGESGLVKKSTQLYLRDLYDHTIHVIDTVETFRDIVSGMLDIYLSSVNNRLNEVMRVLTVIATIFMPLTFLAGVYGMNFHVEKSPWSMPELTWYYGYPLFWAVVVICVVFMVAYFRGKKWI
jgi:magnesium transporter